MARDKVTYESYEQDVFDNPPEGPVGAHRGSRPVMARIAPYIIVLLVAAVLGAGAWAVSSGEYANLLNLKSSSSSTSSTAQSSTSTAKKKSSTSSKDSSKSDSSSDSSASDSSSSTDSSSSSSSDSSQQQAEPQSTVNKATQIRVVNGTGVAGYAGQKADVLKTNGYTSVEAANPSGSLPAATVVWYQNEADKATAQDVANSLGISSVEQVQGLATPIMVVLLN